MVYCWKIATTDDVISLMLHNLWDRISDSHSIHSSSFAVRVHTGMLPFERFAKGLWLAGQPHSSPSKILKPCLKDWDEWSDLV